MSDGAQNPIRVGVVGAAGKMGKVLCAALLADSDCELAAAVDEHQVGETIERVLHRGDGGIRIADRFETLTGAGVDVAVDFTHPDAVFDNVRWYLNHGLHAVIGTTGLAPAQVDEIARLADKTGQHVLISPDFSPAGVIYLQIGKLFARYFDEVELLEIHPSQKAEAPSGTTMNTARTLARVRKGRPSAPTASKEIVPGVLGGVVEGIRVHAFRISGAVGHEEMRFAHQGDTITLSTTSHNREGYAAGVLLAIKSIGQRPGLTWGLEPLLGFDPQ